MNEQLSFEEAKRLSIIKWKAIVKAKGESSWMFLHSIDELKDLAAHCGFCERWKFDENPTKFHCSRCEYGIVAGQCYNHNTLFWQFQNGRSSDDLNKAKQILKIIKSLKENS